MNKIYCDHCGKERKGLETAFQKVYVKKTHSWNESTVLPIDLCEDCAKEFDKLVEDFKKGIGND